MALLKEKVLLKVNKVDVWNTDILNHYISNINKCGKKEFSENIMFTICKDIKNIYTGREEERDKELAELVRKKIKKPFKTAMKILQRAVLNTKTLVRIRTLKKSGRSYEIAVRVTLLKAYRLGLSFILKEPQKVYKGEKISCNKLLLDSIINSSLRVGVSIKKRNDIYLKALENRVFVKFL